MRNEFRGKLIEISSRKTFENQHPTARLSSTQRIEVTGGKKSAGLCGESRECEKKNLQGVALLQRKERREGSYGEKRTFWEVDKERKKERAQGKKMGLFLWWRNLSPKKGKSSGTNEVQSRVGDCHAIG